MIILFGYSKLGAEIASKLKEENYDFAIIEPVLEIRNFAIKDSYTTKIYDFECFDDSELLSFEIETKKVKNLFCVHNEFNRNLFVTLSARNLNPTLQIMALANSKDEEKKLKLAGATTTINPMETTGLRIFRKLDKPLSLQILDGILYHNSGFFIKEIKVEEGSFLVGKYSKNIEEFQKYNLIVLGIQDKELSHEFIFASRGINHKLDAGDILVVLGKDEDVEDFVRFLEQTTTNK